MRRIRHNIVPSLLIAFTAFMALMPCSSGWCGGEFKRIADGRMVPLSGMIDDLRQGKVVFIGELHDNMEHHQLQLDIIRELHQAGVPLAIGLEMFSSQSQPFLDQWVSGEMGLVRFVKVYQENWTIPWTYYDAILLYARNNRIPLIGLNVPREIAQKVYREGFASLSAEEKKNLPPGIACRIDTPYMKFIRKMYQEHEMGGASFEHFCESQAVRNKTMAWLIVNYLKREPQRLVLVLTGVGHAMKRGAPDELEQMSGVPYRVVMPDLSPAAMEDIKSSDADYLMMK